MFPKYKEIREPLLAELSRRGGSSRPSAKDALGRTVYEALADHFDLSPEARDAVIYEKNGAERSKWENMVRWARNDLKKVGLLESPQHGVWALSASGATHLQEYDDERAGHGVVREGTTISPESFQTSLEQARKDGEFGERFVLEEERARLSREGRHDLAERVRHVALENIAAGYDVLSYNEDGSERFIEVKSSRGTSASFEITRNELATARNHRAQY